MDDERTKIVSEDTTFTAILNANAYGARGSFHMSRTYCYEKRGNIWIAVNEKK